MARRDRALAGLAFALAAGLCCDPALSETQPQKAAKPAAKGAEAQPVNPNDPKQMKAALAEAVQKAYAAGTKSFEQGKHKDAVPQLSTALAGGGLAPVQMAKALYYRGVANRKLGKPAQAMSDLTTALWVNGGLNESDRVAAMEARQAAYREAGLGDSAPEIKPGPAVAAKPAAAPPAAPAPAVSTAAAPAAPAAAPPVEPVAAAPPPPPAPALEVAAQPVAVEAAPAPAAPPVARTAPVESSGIPSPFGEPDAPRARPQAAPPSEPQLAAVPNVPTASEPSMLEKAGSSVAEAGSNVSKFFGNMFSGGGSSSPPPAQTAAATPAPVDPQTSASPVMTAANPDGAIGNDWGQATEVRSQGTPAAAAKVAMAQPPAAPAASSAPPAASPVSTGALPAAAAASRPQKGKYLLQIGAVRTRAEAEQLVQKVMAGHAGALGGREPMIDEAVIGNFGSFHRVRIAPFAEAKEPGKLCGSLMKSGFDCLVLTQ